MSDRERLTRATMVVKTNDGLYLTVCKACKKRHARTGDTSEEFALPAKKFGTKPEANDYMRAHERTAYHHRNVRIATDGTVTPEEKLLREIFGEKAVDPPCPECGSHHPRWATCYWHRPLGR